MQSVWVSLIYANWWRVSLVLLYSYILYVIHLSRCKALKSPFFLIFKVTGICDILVGAGLVYHYCQSVFGFGYYVPYLTNITLGWSGAHFFTHFLGNLLMDIHQNTGTRYPVFHRKLWTLDHTKYALIVTTVLSYGINLPAFTSEFKWQLRNGTTNLYDFRGGATDIKFLHLVTSAFVFVYQISSLFLSISTLLKINTIEFAKIKANLADKSLAFFSLTNTVLCVFECTFEAVSAFKIEGAIKDFFIQYINTYLFALLMHNAISILVLSPTVRREIRKRWTRKGSRTFLVIPPTTTGTR